MGQESVDDKEELTKGPPPSLPGYLDGQEEASSSAPQSFPPPPAFETRFASLSLHKSDRIRLLKFPENVKNTIRQIIASSGHTTVQDERASYHGSYEFKMHGNPWRASGDDAVHSRRLMNRVVGDLFNMGWLLSLSTDISKNAEDLDTLIFRYHLPPPPPCEWLAVAFSSGDKLRLIGAPSDLRDAAVAAMQRAKKLQAHRPHAYVGDCYELKMWGYPFRSSGSDSMGARALVLDFLSVLESQGWSVYASIGQKKHNEDNNNNNDTWHCCRRLDWSPGLPVYHH